MGQVHDKPVPGQRYGDPDRNTPNQPRQPAYRIEQDGPWQLLQHPARFQPTKDPVTCDPRLHNEQRGMSQYESGVHLQHRVTQERKSIGVEIVAGGLPLRPIAHVMRRTMPIGPAIPTKVPR